MSKSQEDLTREKILTGANELFQRFGLKKTTMDDIAKSVGMGKSSLYYYFKSKEEVFDSVLEDELLKLRSAVDAAVSKEQHLPEILTAYAHTFFKELIPRETLYRIVNESDSEVGSALRLQRIVEFEVDYLSSILAKHRGTSSTEQPELNAQISAFAETIVCAIYGIIHYSFMTDKEPNKQKIADMINLLVGRLF